MRRQLQTVSGFRLVGPGWEKKQNAATVKLVWQSLDALSCTDYLAVIRKNNPAMAINAGPTRSWAWGDWGLTRRDAVTLDFAKWQQAWKAKDEGRMVRLLVHELGHAYSRTPQAKASYARFGTLYRSTGNFGPYAYNANENYSEVIGYYVARCARGNPYDAKKFEPYYRHVRSTVFKGKEFGPAAGTRATCGPAAPGESAARADTAPARPTTSAVKSPARPVIPAAQGHERSATRAVQGPVQAVEPASGSSARPSADLVLPPGLSLAPAGRRPA